MITVRPAHQVTWDELQTVFGSRGYPASCQCQRFKVGPAQWSGTTQLERMQRLRREAHCDQPDAKATSGLVAFLDSEPVGWCAVEPRTHYSKLPPARLAWKERGEDKDDATVWAVTCFAVRAGYRGRGITKSLLLAAVEYARQEGARALEGYPMVRRPGEEITWGENHVGIHSVFTEVGFREVAHPTLRRMVMRMDFF